MVLCPACNSRYEEGVVFCPRDGTHVEPEEGIENLIGTVLADRYRVIRKLGEGGMGEVYEAAHVYIEKRFALKLLRKEIMSNSEAVTRFHKEARAASAIGHENIVEIDDFGRLPDGRVYLTMEFLDGQSLAEVAREPLEPLRALDLMCQVCRGLAAAHQKGIIHRDMKPENVFLVQREGRELVKVLDFGIAKVASGGEAEPSHLTRTGTIFGTPHYMSPEQAQGSAIDARTDIYSVGIILYELFAGRVPFRGNSFMAILMQHITSPPMPPRQAAPDRNIPPGVEAIILRAIAKDPAARHPSMQALLEELGAVARALGGAAAQGSRPQTARGIGPAPIGEVEEPMVAPPIEAAPPSATPPVAPAAAPAAALDMSLADDSNLELPLERNRAPLVAGGLLLAALVGGGSFLLFRDRGPQSPAASAGPAPALATPAQEPAASPPPQGGRVVSILLDTEPPGAAIMRDGARISDTPEQFDVTEGTTLRLDLHRDGFRDVQVTLDPSKGRKLIIKLERARTGYVHSHAKMPAPPLHPKPRPIVREGEPRPVSESHAESSPPKLEPVAAPPPVVSPGERPITVTPPPAARPVVIPPPPLSHPPTKPGPKAKDPYERLDQSDEPKDPY